MKKFKVFFTFTLVLTILSCESTPKNNSIVKSVEEFNVAVKNLQPGDSIVLANGIWDNAELLFEGKGTAEKPIKLTVQEKGKVTLEGASNLQIAGEYLIVEGLVFKKWLYANQYSNFI